MKTKLELRIDIDMEAIVETGYTEEEITTKVMRLPFSSFTFKDWTSVVLDNKAVIQLLPYFTASNTFVIRVTCF